MKKYIILYCLLMIMAVCAAQTQQGYVKTRGRLGNNGALIAGQRLSGATISIKGRNAVQSGNKGTFSFAVPTKSFLLTNVQKNGYQLCDRDFLSRQYQVSGNPLIVVMETPDNTLADKLAAESKIHRTLSRQLLKMQDELETLKEQQKITEEQYRKRLQELINAQENNQKLISEMAERYSTIDFDQMDDFQRQVAAFIQNGELTRANSLLNTKGSMEERSKELDRMDEAIKANAERLAKEQEEQNKSIAMKAKALEDFAADCYSRYEICLMQHKNDSAAYWLELRASRDTMNVKWLLETGSFIDEYLANYKLALNYYQKALNAGLEQYGENHSDVATCYNNIGTVYNSQGNYALALEYYQKALKIRLDVYGENHPSIATSYNNIGLVYDSQNSYASALENVQKALNIWLEVYGQYHPDVATSYNNLGIIYSHQGNYTSALEKFHKALTITIKINDDNHPDIAQIHHNLGSVYEALGKYTSALENFQIAFKIWSKVYGNTHPHIATNYNNIGKVYYSQGDYGLALDYYQKALKIRLDVYGENHPDVAMSYNNIGVVYNSQGNYVLALDYFQKALNIWLNVYGENHSSVAMGYNNIGNIYDNQGNYGLALDYYQKALKIRLNVYGEHHPDVAASYNNIGTVFNLLENYSSALEYNQKALNIRLDVYGGHHPDVAGSYNNLGTIYYHQDNYGLALDYYQKALNIWFDIYGKHHSTVGTSYNNIGLIYVSLDNYTLASEYIQKALKIRLEIYGNNHPDVALCYYNLGSIYDLQENYVSALEYYHKAFKIWSDIYGDNHPNVIRSYSSIGDVYLSAKSKGMDLFGYNEFIKKSVFSATILGNDTPAAKCGMIGEYIMLEYADWVIDSDNNLYDKSEELQGKPKTILVMKNGIISQHYFENTIGIQLGMKNIGAEEKQHIIKAYHKWKEKNK